MKTFDLVLTPNKRCILSSPGLWAYPIVSRYSAADWFAALDLAEKSLFVRKLGWQFPITESRTTNEATNGIDRPVSV